MTRQLRDADLRRQEAQALIRLAHRDEPRNGQPTEFSAILRRAAYRIAPIVAARELRRLQKIRWSTPLMEEDSYGSSVR